MMQISMEAVADLLAEQGIEIGEHPDLVVQIMAANERLAAALDFTPDIMESLLMALGLVAKLAVSKDICAEMRLPRDTGVRLQVSHDRLELMMIRYRRWWQFWRPKAWTKTIAEKPYSAKVGDTVQLMQQMWTYTVTVNDDEVLRYPPEP